jgi:hypothetical protein
LSRLSHAASIARCQSIGIAHLPRASVCLRVTGCKRDCLEQKQISHGFQALCCRWCRESRIQLFGRGAQLGGDVALDAHDGLALESPEDGAGSSSDEQGGSETGDDDSDSGAGTARVLESSAGTPLTHDTWRNSPFSNSHCGRQEDHACVQRRCCHLGFWGWREAAAKHMSSSSCLCRPSVRAAAQLLQSDCGKTHRAACAECQTVQLGMQVTSQSLPALQPQA